jgi:predicted peptidase
MQRLILTAVFFALMCFAQGQTTAVIKARYLRGNVTYGDVTIPYRYYVPQNYSSANKYAIITFLHGIGERGSDNDKQLIRAPIILANDTVQSMYKFFIIAPQVRDFEKILFDPILDPLTNPNLYSAPATPSGRKMPQ